MASVTSRTSMFNSESTQRSNRCCVSGAEHGLIRVPLTEVGIRHKEAVGVPQRIHELAHSLANQIDAKAAAISRRAGGVHVPACGVGAVGIEDFPRVNDVAL